MLNLGSMKLNADLGESFGNWQFDTDSQIMPLVDMANIACGGHAGDPSVMHKTIQLALHNGVSIGAHPSYPDLQGFGRRSMRIPHDDLCYIIQAQLSMLDGMSLCQGGEVSFVKPHGALYNDFMLDAEVRKAVFAAVSGFYKRLPLVVQASSFNDALSHEAAQYGLSLLFEAFADRRYTDSGMLMPRRTQGAVLSGIESIEQARRLMQDHEVVSHSGAVLPVVADTLCVHGDNPEALNTLKRIRVLLQDKLVKDTPV